MACLPGMPCYSATSLVFPFLDTGCGESTSCFTSNKIIYNGPNLPCTGIQTMDTVEVAFQKIDERMCSDQFVSHIINTIENNPVLKAYFCQLVSSCATP